MAYSGVRKPGGLWIAREQAQNRTDEGQIVRFCACSRE